MANDPEPAVTLPWLVRLRWLFLAGELVVLPVARWGYGAEFAWAPIIAALVVAALSNLAIARVAWAPSRVMGVVLLVDIALLTTLLAASGGAMNPFTVFYLVHITLSAVVLDARWTTAIAVAAVASYGLLFFVIPPASMMHHDMHGMNTHLHGMWIAFVLAALLTAFFVRRIATAIGAQREQIASLREGSARNARLAALTTLAAGAAHELNSPLATIAVAAHEASLRVERGAVADDLDLILAEVDRCQAILHQMAARSVEADAPTAISLSGLAALLREDLGDRGARVDVELPAGDAELSVPAAQVVQALYALVKNALDASPADARVTVEMRAGAGGAEIAVADRGSGIPAHVLAKVGEPFFTTKPPGAGLGLGVFLARAFVESRGGELALGPRDGGGTRAVVRLPVTS